MKLTTTRTIFISKAPYELCDTQMLNTSKPMDLLNPKNIKNQCCHIQPCFDSYEKIPCGILIGFNAMWQSFQEQSIISSQSTNQLLYGGKWKRHVGRAFKEDESQVTQFLNRAPMFDWYVVQ